MTELSPFLLSLPFVCAAIGWLTNILAIKSLFHPKKPRRFFGMTIQGVFPKRQDKIAVSLGHIIANQLLSKETFHKELSDTEKTREMSQFFQQHIESFIEASIKKEKRSITTRLMHGILKKNKKQLATSIAKRLPIMAIAITQSPQFTTTIQKIVVNKVNDFSSDELEHVLNGLIKSELKFIETLGGVIGFIVGLLQLGLILVL